jgi:hypothetical protein
MVLGGQEGPQLGKPYLDVFILKKKIFSRTSWPISIKLDINHFWVKGLNYSNKGPGDNYKNAKMGWCHLKIFLSRTT